MNLFPNTVLLALLLWIEIQAIVFKLRQNDFITDQIIFTLVLLTNFPVGLWMLLTNTIFEPTAYKLSLNRWANWYLVTLQLSVWPYQQQWGSTWKWQLGTREASPCKHCHCLNFPSTVLCCCSTNVAFELEPPCIFLIGLQLKFKDFLSIYITQKTFLYYCQWLEFVIPYYTRTKYF